MQTQDLIPADAQTTLPARANETSALIQVIERIAMSPDADVTKLEKMLDMQERVLDRNAKEAFTADLAAMQIELPRVIEHGTDHNNAKFAKLEDINDALRPTLHRFGFAVTFRTRVEGSAIVVTTVLSHRGGHSEETEIPLPADTTGGKTAVQAIGSTISYGKRYGICALLNISTGDDTDGASPAPRATDPAFISDHQLSRLRDALLSAGKSESAFCKKARIPRLEDLEAARYDAAINLILGNQEAR